MTLTERDLIRPCLRWQGCCKVLIHAPDLLKRARRSARSEGRQRSWRRQADHHIALTSEPSTAPHAGGPPNRWLGWSDSACCLPSLQVSPRNADFAMALPRQGVGKVVSTAADLRLRRC